jgi:type II secretory pathway pseudopilin PulG
LIEMIIVIFMIGILSAIVAPSWLGFVNRQKLNKASDSIYSALKSAQSEAKAKKLNYSASFRVTNNVVEYIVYSGTTAPASGWTSLSSAIGLNARDVLFYSNLTAVNTATADKKIVQTTSGSATVTFDYLGALANKTNNTIPDMPLKVMVAPPVTGGTAAGTQKRCIIIEGLIAGMRLDKDAGCNN